MQRTVTFTTGQCTEFQGHVAGASSPFASCNDVICSDTHTSSSRASSHTLSTASIRDLNFKVLFFACGFACCTQQLSYTSTCLRPWTHPVLLFAFFLFPSSDSVHHCNGVGDRCLYLCGVVQVEFVLHKRQPKPSHDIFSCELGACTQFYIWPISSCLFVKKNPLFFPFRCTPLLRSLAAGAGAKHHLRPQAFGSSVTLVWSPLRSEALLSTRLLMAMAPPSGGVSGVFLHSSDGYDGRSPWRRPPCVTTPTTRPMRLDITAGSPGHLLAFRLMTMCLPRPTLRPLRSHQ